MIEKFKDITTYSTILSVIGAYFVALSSSNDRLIGFSVWTISNAIWCYYFFKTKQYNPMILFAIYLLTSIIGIYNNI